MKYLLAYSDTFATALALWPLVSLLLTLPILAFLYRRDGRLRFFSALGAYLSVLYLLGLVCFTLYPLPTGDSGPGITYGIAPRTDILGFIGDLKRNTKYAVFQLGANVVLFIPFGFILCRGLGAGVVTSTFLGAATSTLIETAQLTGLFGVYAYAYRTFDVDDILTNTTGALIGCLVALALGHFLPRKCDPADLEVTAKPGFIRRLVALCLDAFFIAGCTGIVYAGGQWLVRRGYLQALPTHAGYYVLAVFVVLLEFFVPLLGNGQTLGGFVVRMTCDTKSRHGALRLAFYLARIAVFGLLLLSDFDVVTLFACAMVWVFKRQMPYDLIPASAPGGRANATYR